ncbi:fatty acid desaturase-domain-containing protein [Hyaloraphidium curvatum]|nr:fatty acid desaturase-domain-containing protein [Hyaloraphidium curvatum]
MPAAKRAPRSSGDDAPAITPQAQDNAPRRRRPSRPELLDVDADPVAAPEDAAKAAPKLTGNVPPDFKGLPPFTLKQLRDAVPAHCFERSFLRSFAYVVYDGIALAAMYYGMWKLQGTDAWAGLPWAARAAGWGLWGFVTGVFGTGWWVLAHECGHHAFSPNPALNNLVGYILHTLLLVPYYSWQITHAKHHHHTGHMTKDQVFVPATRSDMGLPAPKGGVKVMSEQEAMLEALKEEPTSELATVPIVHIARILFMWTLGWPGYLAFNAAGQKHDGWTSHFNPSAAIFAGVKNARSKVINSDIGIVAMIAALVYAGHVFGTGAVWRWYLMPWLWVNFWLVTITFLQHTHPAIPHYRAPTWTFTLGALATVDRSYGILDYLFHHITDTHVAHHLFSTMPHYNAGEATEALKKVMGEWYHFSDEGVLSSVWKSWTECRFVEDEGDVLFFKK